MAWLAGWCGLLLRHIIVREGYIRLAARGQFIIPDDFA
jgi:hypothetical protein